MSVQARAYGISLGIHALVFSSILVTGLITPRTRAVVLNFSIGSSIKTEQTAAAPSRQRNAASQVQKTMTPTAQEEQAVPIQKERIEEAPQPVSRQPMMVKDEAGDHDAPAQAGYLSAQFVPIRNKIIRNLTYPAIARTKGWSGKVVVAFTVCPDGGVEELSIVESSGFPVLDKSALETIKKSCPLPKPPVSTALIMPVVYKLQ